MPGPGTFPGKRPPHQDLEQGDSWPPNTQRSAMWGSRRRRGFTRRGDSEGGRQERKGRRSSPTLTFSVGGLRPFLTPFLISCPCPQALSHAPNSTLQPPTGVSVSLSLPSFPKPQWTPGQNNPRLDSTEDISNTFGLWSQVGVNIRLCLGSHAMRQGQGVSFKKAVQGSSGLVSALSMNWPCGVV